MPVAGLDLTRVRADFPILGRTVRGGKPLAYLDNAASTQKPQAVIDAIVRFYTERYSNVHRGVHELSELATCDFEGTRERLVAFLNAAGQEEVVFTHGSTEAVNLVARGMDERFEPGDEVLLTEMEHHSNIVPWQMLRERTGAVLRVAPIDDDGDLMLDRFEELLGPRTRMVVVSHGDSVRVPECSKATEASSGGCSTTVGVGPPDSDEQPASTVTAATAARAQSE